MATSIAEPFSLAHQRLPAFTQQPPCVGLPLAISFPSRPALPDHWKATESFHGLRARSGVVASYSVVADRAPNRGPVTVRVNGQDVLVTPTGA